MPSVLQLALLAGVALCVALLLQRAGINNSGSSQESKAKGPAGHFPPMLHRKVAPEPARTSGGHFSRAHNPEAIARAKGGTAAGGKSNLAGQIIPVYGFGILLYILYIIFKITSKGKTTQPHEKRFPAVRSENMKRKITDFELNQLQERLKETEEVMEKIVSRAQAQCGSPERRAPVSAAQEEALLLQLREITRVMQEGQLVEGFSPEQKATDLSCEHYVDDYPDGTVYPDEPMNEWHQHCCKNHCHQSSKVYYSGMDGEKAGEMDGEIDKDRAETRANGGNMQDGEQDQESLHRRRRRLCVSLTDSLSAVCVCAGRLHTPTGCVFIILGNHVHGENLRPPRCLLPGHLPNVQLPRCSQTFCRCCNRHGGADGL